MKSNTVYKEGREEGTYYYIIGLEDLELFFSIKKYLIKNFSAIIHMEDIGVFTAKTYFLIENEEVILKFHEDVGIFFYSSKKIINIF